MKVRLTVAYDGTSFRGWAPNRNIDSVSDSLTRSISTVLRCPVHLVVAGRTDAGVHALGQVVSFVVPAEIAPLDAAGLARLERSVNGMCAPAIAVSDVQIVDDSFDARRSATRRRYRYVVLNTLAPDPFMAHRAWHVTTPLDLRHMQMACDPLIGEHDFAAFCRQAPPPHDSTVRRVFEARWTDEGAGRLHFEIEANAFCHQQVRATVGMMVVIGRGQLTAGDVMGLLHKADRVRMPDLAPAHGLYLIHVGYEGERVHPKPAALAVGPSQAVT